MITFRQKSFSEFDAMKSLYNELRRNMRPDQLNKMIINSSQLIPVLKGNSVVIEKFVITSSFLNPDKYRMYLRIGARAKLPESLRLPGFTRKDKIGNLQISFKNGLNTSDGGQVSPTSPVTPNPAKGFVFSDTTSGEFEQRLYGGKSKGGGGGGGFKPLETKFDPYINLERDVTTNLGEVIVYDKKTRTAVIEYNSIENAIRSLWILPFGLNYSLYLLDN